MGYTEKQLQILEVAEKLFANQGFDGTSVRDIAAAADVNLAMISYYFKSKENLMQAIFVERMDHIRVRVESLRKDQTLGPLEKMELLVEENIERILHRQKFYKIMVCEQLINKNPVIIKLVSELKKSNQAAIGKLIQDGQKKGVFKKDIDVILLLSTLFGTVTQMLSNKEYYREVHHMEEEPDEKFEVFLKDRLSHHIKSIFKAILVYEP